MALMIALPTPLLIAQIRWAERSRNKSIERLLEAGATLGSTKACSKCDYSLVGIARTHAGKRVLVACPECGDVTVLGRRDVQDLELREAVVELNRAATP